MATVDSSVFWLSLAELNAKLRAKEFSCVELTRAACDRLAAEAPKYNALAVLLRDAALAKARDVDDQIKRGRLMSALQGAPFGAKDLLSYAGHPTQWGAPPLAGQTLNETATVLTKLERAGAVLTAKLAMVELAGGGGYRFPAASLHGPGRNPWDRERWSGGSSSGSAAAVAAGLVPFALGSETNGSILTPAAYCGVTGLRPTYGLVSRHGAMALAPTMDKIGPLCRTAEDCGIVLQAIAGGDFDDPSSANKNFYYAPQFARKFSDLKVGFAPVDFDGWAAEALRPALKAALDAVRAMGVQMEETQLPDFPYGEMVSVIVSAEGSAEFEELIRSGRVDELADRRQAAGLKAGLNIKQADYARAMRIRGQMQRALRQQMRNFDVLIAPARMSAATSITQPLDAGDGRLPPAQRGMSDLISAGNLAGLPALALPCGFAQVEGKQLPVGIQLVGRAFGENTLLALGREYQRHTDWHRRQPKS
jgi:aspartyl-tRNA(Asn)/glutamyl-tRNA(Gln) amidotransferase subunit A